jgi:hypothetical protein
MENDLPSPEHSVSFIDFYNVFTPFTVDFDECSNVTSPCHADADCVNIPGNYTCMCKLGFSGDGKQNCVG